MPSEYVSSGRYFQSIEMSEGEDVTMSVIDLLGEDILMYASDYPHTESWFPISVELVIGWTRIPESAKMKLFWAACSSSISVVAGRLAPERWDRPAPPLR